MQVFLFGALAVFLVAVVFALQNIVPVTVAFLGWTFQGSLALVLFVAFVFGALTSVLASLPAMVRSRRSGGQHRKAMAAIEANLAECERKVRDAQVGRRELGAAPTQGPSSGAAP